MRLSRKITAALKLTVAIALLAWLATSGRLDFGVLKGVVQHWHWLILAQVTFGLVQLMIAFRWRRLLQIVGVQCTVGQAFKLILGGLFFNQLLFGSTGGDVYRVMALGAGRPKQRPAVLVSVIADRVIGLFALIVLVPIGAIINVELIRENSFLAYAVFGALALSMLVPGLIWLILSRSAKWRKRNRDNLRESQLRRGIAYIETLFEPFVQHQLVLWKSLLFSVVIYILIVATNILLAFGLLGTDISWQPFLLLIPIAHLGMAIPINPPGALGTGEALYSYLLNLAGVSQGSIVSLLQRATTILWSLPGWLVLVLPSTSAGSAGGQIGDRESAIRLEEK